MGMDVSMLFMFTIKFHIKFTFKTYKHEFSATGSPKSGSEGGKPGLPVREKESKVLRVVQCLG